LLIKAKPLPEAQREDRLEKRALLSLQGEGKGAVPNSKEKNLVLFSFNVPWFHLSVPVTGFFSRSLSEHCFLSPLARSKGSTATLFVYSLPAEFWSPPNLLIREENKYWFDVAHR
jgi:hypothetical protein